MISHAFIGQLDTDIGPINILSTELSSNDNKSNFGVRLGIGRDDYAIPPGVYAVGNPTSKSPVLVTSNYKLTVDKLRCELKGLKIWILVINTKGVNVWCAAGKGTFSTEEIIFRIKKYKLNKLVSHNTLILPQLCAPGVSAYQISKYTGFKAIYGPIYAKDIRDYLKNKLAANEEMRRVKFDIGDRIAVSPIETFTSLKFLPFIYLFFVVISLISGGKMLVETLTNSLLNTIPYAVSMIIGSIVFPILLPFMPFRMFSLKSGVLGIICSVVVMMNSHIFAFENSIFTSLGNLFLLTSIVSFLGFNFTGSTTFTSLSGVKKESRIAIPIICILFILGIVFMIIKSLLLRF